ncbi:MAG: sugar phosphate isomerase/epimerase [bacterium]|nr:sugar phosphate isomerase/epimerase [bacterium]
MYKTSMAISPTPADFAPLLFAGEWEAALDAAVELGYDAIEMSLRDSTDPVVVACNEGLGKHGLRLSAIATGQSFYSDGWSLTTGDPAVRTRLDERMLRMVDMAAPWEAMVVIGGVRGELTGTESERTDQYRRFVESVHRYATYALPLKVSLAVEPINRYETNLVATIDQAMAVVDEVDLPNVGVLADTFHMNIEERDLAGALRSAGDRLLHVQLTDSNRLAAGQGHIDFAALAAELRRINYQGYLSAETLPEPDSYAAARAALEYFKKL